MIFPPDLTYPLKKLITAHQVGMALADALPARRAVVQAGGCAGLWPVAFASYFDRVYTFEPVPANFSYLQANVAPRSNVTAFPMALGETTTRVGMTRPKPQAGLWRVDGDGEIPMVRLDDVVDGPVDAIVLDVEGYELPALRGAERLMAQHRPALLFECHGPIAEMASFLAAQHYAPPVLGMGGDYYSVPQ